MAKRLLFTFLGFLLVGVGFFLGYLGLLGIERDGNVIFLIPAFPLIGAGIFLLYKAGRMETAKLKFKELAPTDIKGGNVVDRNNKMAAEWNNTNNMRDKLKVVQASTIVDGEQQQ